MTSPDDNFINMRSSGGYWYLASPYRAYDPGAMYKTAEDRLQAAFEAACRFAARLMDFEVNVFSPVAHCHHIAKFTELSKHSDAWLQIQKPYMEGAKGLLIGRLPGWENSTGLAYERRHFIWTEKPCFFLDPDFTLIPGVIRR